MGRNYFVVQELRKGLRGRTVLRGAIRQSIRYRLHTILPADDVAKWDVLPSWQFWKVIAWHAAEHRRSLDDAFFDLADEWPDPAKDPPHPFLRAV